MLQICERNLKATLRPIVKFMTTEQRFYLCKIFVHNPPLTAILEQPLQMVALLTACCSSKLPIRDLVSSQGRQRGRGAGECLGGELGRWEVEQGGRGWSLVVLVCSSILSLFHSLFLLPYPPWFYAIKMADTELRRFIWAMESCLRVRE